MSKFYEGQIVILNDSVSDKIKKNYKCKIHRVYKHHPKFHYSVIAMKKGECIDSGTGYPVYEKELIAYNEPPLIKGLMEALK